MTILSDINIEHDVLPTHIFPPHRYMITWYINSHSFIDIGSL